MAEKRKLRGLSELESRIALDLAKIRKRYGVSNTMINKLLALFKATDKAGEKRGLRFGDAILKSQDLCPRCREILFGKEK